MIKVPPELSPVGGELYEKSAKYRQIYDGRVALRKEAPDPAPASRQNKNKTAPVLEIAPVRLLGMDATIAYVPWNDRDRCGHPLDRVRGKICLDCGFVRD